jgi:predicted DNA-binding transcriptional regulator AlpA
MTRNNLDLLRERKLRERLGISHSTIWRMLRNKRFPEPIRLSARVKAWRLADIERWLSERASQPSVDRASRD